MEANPADRGSRLSFAWNSAATAALMVVARMPCKEQLRSFAAVERFEKDFATVRLVVVWEMEARQLPTPNLPTTAADRTSVLQKPPSANLRRAEPVLATRETGAL